MCGCTAAHARTRTGMLWALAVAAEAQQSVHALAIAAEAQQRVHALAPTTSARTQTRGAHLNTRRVLDRSSAADL